MVNSKILSTNCARFFFHDLAHSYLQDHTDFGTISGEVLPDKSCTILQGPSQKVMQDLSGMISPDIVPKLLVILHTKSCKIKEVFNPRSCLCDFTGIIMRDLSRLLRHDLYRYIKRSVVILCMILHARSCKNFFLRLLKSGSAREHKTLLPLVAYMHFPSSVTSLTTCSVKN